MANYSPNDALTQTVGYVRQMTIDSTTKALCCDMTNNAIHSYYPWRWTLGALTPISLVDNTQDYSVANTDVYRFVRLRVTRTDITPNKSNELNLTEWLAPDLQTKGTLESFRAIAWDPVGSKLRLDVTASVPSGVTMRIEGEYQKLPTKITSSSVGTALTQPDVYFNVFVEGLLYYLYKYADDQRAGGVQVMKGGQRQYTGQLAVFMFALQAMAEAEDYGNAQGVRFPSEPLGVGRGPGNPGLFL